jgi:hypothetical protein
MIKVSLGNAGDEVEACEGFAEAMIVRFGARDGE